MSEDSRPAAIGEMPWIKWLDLDVTVEANGTVTATLARPKPEHLNHNHAINAAVAEVAGAGAAVLSLLDQLDTIYTVVETATITYTAPAKSGLVADARIEPSAAASVRKAIARRQQARVAVNVGLADLNGRSTGGCELTMALRPRRA